jgi:geranylgeranyl reductase family protein
MGAEPYDVLVIGAGPAGAVAARVAADAGVRVLLLERARIPRYKTCGGGLIGLSRGALPAGVADVRARIDRFTFTKSDGHLRRLRRTRASPAPFLEMVYRDELDAALVDAAKQAGAEIRDGVTVNGLDESDGLVSVRTSEGAFTARAVVGGDGTAGRTGTYVGVRTDQVDLGLEVEIDWPDQTVGGWDGRVLIDWGPLPGSYGWVFPKGTALTVGVIAAKGDGAATKAYLESFLADLGLAEAPRLRSSGHLTRCRAEDSPLARGRVLVAGDAAGLLEPWTREGISYALRSGEVAGTAAVSIAAADDDAEVAAATDRYAAGIEAECGAEMRAGRLFHTAFLRRPHLFHFAVSVLPIGWRVFQRFVVGDLTLARIAAKRPIRILLRAMA